MTIKYLGHASFLIKTKDAKAITDPYDSSIGLKFPKEDADIVTVSHEHEDHNASASVSGQPLIIDLPGEYEKKGIVVQGFNTYHDKAHGAERGENILFRIEAEGISMLHCGDLGLVPEDSFLDTIGNVDILMVPVGGHYTITADEAIELAKKLEPAIVIPMHYNRSGLDQKTFGQLTTLDDFLKKMGVESAAVPQLTIKQEDLEGEMKVVVFES